MRGLRALYLVVVLVAGLAAGSGPGAVQAGSLGGLVLVASESMPDPRFREAVIYLVDHGESGAFGFIVNKPGGAGPIATLLDELEIDPGDDVAGGGTIAVHYGGPVAPGRGFVLHSTDYAVDGTRAVSDEIALTASAQVLRDIARGRGPRRSLLLFGYCGWGPAQLEGELARGDWAIVAAEDDLILGDDHDAKWRRAWRVRVVI